MTEVPHSAALQADEALSARTATHPRVSVDDLNANIAEMYYVNAGQAVDFLGDGSRSPPQDHPLRLLTLCFIVTRAGFTIVGKSAPASPENFDAEKGRVFAYEDALRTLWPMMGYHLVQQLHETAIDHRARGVGQ